MKNQFEIETTSGRSFTFSFPEPAKCPSFFVFSLPKAGSTLLNNIMGEVCYNLNIPVINLPTKIFNIGIVPNELTNDVNRVWRESGYAYLGFRNFWPTLGFDFTKTKNILLVRDPRDILVSLYFSLKYSHKIPDDHPMLKHRKLYSKIGIDEAVLKEALKFKNQFHIYLKNLGSTSTTRVYRYEDVVFRKREWLVDILDFLGLKLDCRKIQAIADKYDVRPDKEDPQKHIRQVTPGNYKAHLSQKTIDRLDEIFWDEMDIFNYHSVISFKMGRDKETTTLKQQIDDQRAQERYVTQLKSKLDFIQNSWSWRITKPLRVGQDLLTKILHHISKKLIKK